MRERRDTGTLARLTFVAHVNLRSRIVADHDHRETPPAQTERANLAFGEVMDLAIRLGGTITGEHGTGRLKSPWLADYLGEDVLELNRRVKRALDPDGLLNPGVIF